MDRSVVLEAMSERHFNLIRLADQKAQFLLRLTLMLIGVAFIGVPPSILALKKFLVVGGWQQLALFGVVGVLYCICTLCLLVALSKIISAVRPRTTSGGQFPSRLHFVNVAHSSPNEFLATLNQLDEDRWLDEMTGQTYRSSIIAAKKMEEIRRAIFWLMGGGLVGLMFALILLVSHGLTDGPESQTPPSLPPTSTFPTTLPHIATGR